MKIPRRETDFQKETLWWLPFIITASYAKGLSSCSTGRNPLKQLVRVDQVDRRLSSGINHQEQQDRKLALHWQQHKSEPKKGRQILVNKMAASWRLKNNSFQKEKFVSYLLSFLPYAGF